MDERVRFCAYVRVSTRHAEQIDSLENQKAFFINLAQKNHWELVRVYADEGISGRQLKRREQFNQMLLDAETNLFNLVVVKDITRFARNTVDFLTALRRLKRLGITVQFMTNNMTNLGDSEFILTIFGALAQEESANLSHRVSFGKRMNAKRGRVPSRIYGYEHLDNYTLRIQPAEANVIRRIFDLYLQGWGCKRIAAHLTAEGIPTYTGCAHWQERSIRKMLSYPIYAGVLYNHRSVTRDFLTGERRLLPPDQWYRHERPQFAIIPPEIYQAVQSEKQRRSLPTTPETEKPLRRLAQYKNSVHRFSTLFVCAACQSTMIRKTRRRKDGSQRIYWVCYRHDQHLLLPSGPLRGAYCPMRQTFSEESLQQAISSFMWFFVDDFNVFLSKANTFFRHQTGLAIKQLPKNAATSQNERYMDSAWLAEQLRSYLNDCTLTNEDFHTIFDHIELTESRQALFYLKNHSIPVWCKDIAPQKRKRKSST